MPNEKNYLPESVKLQVLEHAGCILAISVWNDSEAKALAEQFGAKALIDKARLSSSGVMPLAVALTHCDSEGSNGLTNFAEFVLKYSSPFL
jgi:hypothetical protein